MKVICPTNVKKAVMLLTLAATTRWQWPKAPPKRRPDLFGRGRGGGRRTHRAVPAQVEANGAKLRWDPKRRGDVVQQLMKDPAILRAEEGKKVQLKIASSVQEELRRFETIPAVTVLCSVVTKMREPFAAIARLNEGQVEVVKAAAAA